MRAKTEQRLCALLLSLFTLLFCHAARGQDRGVASGPVCVKCTAGPQGGTPSRHLMIHVLAHDRPVKNAAVTLTDTSGVQPDVTLNTGSSGVAETDAVLGTYKVSAHKRARTGSTNVEVRSGAGPLDVPVPLGEASK